MTFNAGELVATIRLDGISGFDRDVDRAGQKFTGLGGLASKAGSLAEATLKAAAGATVAATTAAGAYALSLLKTGVAYNTLQQTSRAALASLVGGTEQANAQMDKLDAFARTSPFSKSVFISAQQQLLGFGVQAEKVLPTLDAIQNAVAATGGSSASIGEITTVLAQVSAAGKITGEDLLQLGARGINAADLIGSQMGLTGAEIKDKISEGSLGATEALDALTAGMAAKFAGASANVKNTFAGTVDRVKAASREIGAALAEPFVSQQGGGLAVTWGNQVADVMRSVLADTSPVVSILMERLSPAVAFVTGTLDKANVTVKAWDASSLEKTMNRLSAYTPAVLGFGAAFAALGANTLILSKLGFALNPVAAGILAVAAASPEIRAAGGDILEAFEPLLPVAEDLAGILASELNVVLPVVASGITALASVIRPLVDITASLPTPVLAAVGGLIAMTAIMGPLKAGLTTAATAITLFAEQAAVQTALSGTTGAAGAAAGAFGVAGKAATGMGLALRAAFISNPVGLALLGITTAATLLFAAFSASSEATAKQEETAAALRDTLNETTGAITDTTEAQVRKNLEDAKAFDLADKLGLSYETVTQAAMGNKEALAEVDAASTKYTKTHDSLVNSLDGGKEGMKGESLASYQLSEAIDQQRAALADAQTEQKRWRDSLSQAAAAMTDTERSNKRLNDALAIARDTSRDATERINALRTALDELKGGTLTAAEAEAKLNETNLNLADTLAQADDNGTKLWTTVLDGAGKLDTTSRAGLNLSAQMSAASDGMLTAAQSAYDLAVANGDTAGATDKAQAAAQGYADSLYATLTAAGLTDEQARGLIATYLATPSTVATFITDNGTIEDTELGLLRLAERINSTPDKTVTITEPMSPDIVRRLQDLGYVVTTLPDGSTTVTAPGAQEALDILNRINEEAQDRTVRIDILTTRTETLITNGGGMSGGYPNANGNMIDRGRPLAFANGGTLPTGIYRGRGAGLLRFAEKETRWEAFISGKIGQEARNRKILADAAGRLGMAVVPIGAARPFADGGLLSSQPAGTATAARAEPAGTTVNVSMQITTPPNEDPRIIGRGIAREFTDRIAGTK